ncbi:MAG: hypothetical protein AAGA30_03665 [Planctomycetota bacterium]
MSDFKRKQNFIDQNVQGGLIRRIFFHWVMFFGVTAFAVLSLKTLLGEPSLSFSQRFTNELSEFTYLGVVFAAIFPAFMLDTIRFSNRFVGPITRLRQRLNELADNGETNDVEFRENDFWQEIAAEFNAVNELIRSQKKTIENLQIELDQANSEELSVQEA